MLGLGRFLRRTACTGQSAHAGKRTEPAMTTTAPSPLQPPHLEVRALTCRFGREPAVQNVHLDVASGEHVAIVGGNGSGKTTLLRAIMGLHRGWTGSIRLNGTELPASPEKAHPGMAWMPQHLPKGQFPFTVEELLRAGTEETAVLDAAGELGIGGLLQRPLSALSGGQRQRAYLARALGMLHEGASLLLADEPTAALDFGGQEQVAEILAVLPATMIVVTHDPNMACKCHRVLHMAQGRVREATDEWIPAS